MSILSPDTAFSPISAQDVELHVEKLLEQMSIEQQIGQMMTFEFCGTRITPDVVRAVTEHQCGGLRVTPHVYTALPYGMRHNTDGNLMDLRTAPYAPPAIYAGIINDLQTLALSRRPAIPLHISIDQEGDWSEDFGWGGINLFPSQMGMAATGDEELVYRAYRAVAMQQKAIGVNMLHTPCLDVNTNPENPEICTRSFSDCPDTVIRFAIQQLRAFRDAGIVATGKHFPGRGDSAVDVHFSLDTHHGDRNRLYDIELAPYRELIAEGLPAIMTAHTIYPGLDPSNRPASVSKRIIIGLLREEMGFEGVISTDAMGMKGVTGLFNSFSEACAAAIAAGNDLVLAKGDPGLQGEIIEACHRYLDQGLITEEQIKASVRRILSMKMRYGLIKNPIVAASEADELVKSRELRKVCSDTARACLHVVRDDKNILPLSPDARVFCTMQRNWPYHDKANDFWYHSNMMPEFLREHSSDPFFIDDWETGLQISDEDIKICLTKASACDFVVVLTFFWRSLTTNTELVRALIASGKPVIVVSSSPYENVSIPEAETLILTYSNMPEGLKAAAALIYGKIGADSAKWPLRNYRIRGISDSG